MSILSNLWDHKQTYRSLAERERGQMTFLLTVSEVLVPTSATRETRSSPGVIDHLKRTRLLVFVQSLIIADDIVLVPLVPAVSF